MTTRLRWIILLVFGTVALLGLVGPMRAEGANVHSLGRGQVNGIAWSPQGDVFGVASALGIWIYSDSMRLLTHFDSPPAFGLAWNSTGTRLLTKHTNLCLVWDVATGKVVMEITHDGAHGQATPRVAWNPDSDAIAVSWDGGPPARWELGANHPTFQVSQASYGNASPLVQLLWMPNAWLGITEQGILITWNPDTGEETARESFAAMQYGKFSFDTLQRRVVAFDSFDPYRLTLRDRQTGQTRTTAVEGPISAAVWQLNHDRVLLITERFELQWWETEPDLRLAKRIPILGLPILPAGRPLDVTLAWHPDGNRVLIAGTGMIYLVDTHHELLVGQIGDHAGQVNAMAWSPDSAHLATAHGEDTGFAEDVVRIWDIETAQSAQACFGHTGPVNGIAWSLRGDAITSGAGSANHSDARAILWDATNCQQQTVFAHVEGDFGVLAIQDVAWSTDGRALFTSGTGIAAIWDVPAKARLRWFDVGRTLRFAWQPERRLLAGASGENDVLLFDTETGHEVARLTTGFSALRAVRWSNDGKLLAVAGQQGAQDQDVLQLWNVDARHRLWTTVPAPGWITDVAWHPDGKVIAVATRQGQISLFDAEDGAQIEIRTPSSIPITAIAWSPDGAWLAVGTMDGVLWLLRWP